VKVLIYLIRGTEGEMLLYIDPTFRREESERKYSSSKLTLKIKKKSSASFSGGK
jgi:hypothetical protein